jgi:SNF family Na+-dependent transporter
VSLKDKAVNFSIFLGISGNFITVYLICVIFIGFPITYLHLCLGQYSGCNPIDLFSKLCPAFKGIGWSWLILTVPMLIISNMNSTWALYYTHIAGQSIITGAPLPWTFHDKIFLQQAREVKGSMIEFVNRMAQETNKSQVKPLSLRHPAEISPTTPDYFQ